MRAVVGHVTAQPGCLVLRAIVRPRKQDPCGIGPGSRGPDDSRDSCPAEAGPTTASGCPDGDGDHVSDSSDACPTVAGLWPRGCPAVHRYTTIVSLHRHGRRFTGKVLSTEPACRTGRTVQLRRRGRKKPLGRATTTSAGTFRIVARRRRGPFVVSVTVSTPTISAVCRAASSRRVR